MIEELKGKITDEFYEDVIDLLDIYDHSKFDYLVIRKSSWEKLFVKAVEHILETNILPRDYSGELIGLVNLSVKKYILKELRAGNIRICNNLLLRTTRKFKAELVLRNFVYEFEQLGIPFMEEVYDLVKEKSESFRKILERFDLQNVSNEEFVEYLNKHYKMRIRYITADSEEKSSGPSMRNANDKPENSIESKVSGNIDKKTKKSVIFSDEKKSSLESVPVVVSKIQENVMFNDSEEQNSKEPTTTVDKKKQISDQTILTNFKRKKSDDRNASSSNSEMKDLDLFRNFEESDREKKSTGENLEASDREKKSSSGNIEIRDRNRNNPDESIFNNNKGNVNLNGKVITNDFKNQNPEEFIQLSDDGFKNFKVSSMVIDNELMEKYSHFTFPEIRNMYGDRFSDLDNQNIQLLERFFSVISGEHYVTPYEAEKEINLLQYSYKRKNTEVDSSILEQVYLKNKNKFKLEEALYLECFVFHLQDQSLFSKSFPNGTSIVRMQLINKLEMIYYGIEDIFDASLTKEQYLSVLEKYPNEIEESIKKILDDYYGIYQDTLSIQMISDKYGMSYEEAKELIKKTRKYCLSLYSNLSNSQKADPDVYMPYVLDSRYNLNDEIREVLKLYFAGASYEEIDAKRGKKGSSSLVSVGLQKIDAYRFGVEKVKRSVDDLDTEVREEDILLEIERHPSESVITVEEKQFLSYYLGIRNKYNLEGEKLSGQKLQERLNFKRNIPARYRDVLKKLKQRKVGNLEPEFIIIPREKLSEILMDFHLPITEEDRIIIGSLLEINGYPLKTLQDLAEELKVTVASIRRKYQIAIINISKYLVGEKEGTIHYETDIVPNLKYFTSKERILIEEYFVHHLTNKEISKKYKLPIGKVTRLMYRIKTTLNEYINNPNSIKFDYEYYHSVVDHPNFPFRGDLEQAKKIFDCYVGESTFGRMDIQEIKETLGLDMQPITISRIIDNLVLSTFKYREGIKKENAFSIDDVKSYYQLKRNSLNENELQLIDAFLTKDFGIDMRMSEDLTYLLLKEKYPNYFRIDSDEKVALRLLKKYGSQLPKKARKIFMFYTGIRERDLMSTEEKYQVFLSLSDLDLILKEKSK